MLGRRVLRLDRLDRRGPRRRRDGRRAIHAPPRVGDVRAAPLGRLAGRTLPPLWPFQVLRGGGFGGGRRAREG